MSQGGALAGMPAELQAQFNAIMGGPTQNELPMKQPVRVASTANLTLSGAQTIDGVAAVAGDRVLAKDQTDTTANGIYVIAPVGAWTRADDANEGDEWEAGTVIPVNSGTLGANTTWRCTTASPIVLGTSNLAFVQAEGAIGSGTPASVGTANAAGSSTASARLDHVHNHGAQTVGTLHAAAIAGGTSGFMTGADKTKLDALGANGTYATALVTTADATVTTIATIAIPTSQAVGIVYTVIGKKSDNTQIAVYRRVTGYVNAAGTVAAVSGAPTAVSTLEDDAAWNVTEAISTTNVLIRVTGAAATGINWRIEYGTTIVA